MNLKLARKAKNHILAYLFSGMEFTASEPNLEEMGNLGKEFSEIWEI